MTDPERWTCPTCAFASTLAEMARDVRQRVADRARFFFSTKMNGVDWAAVRAQYEKLLPLLGSRTDLNYLLGEVISELSNSHTYVGGETICRRTQGADAFIGADFAWTVRRAVIGWQDLPRRQHREYYVAIERTGTRRREGDYLLAVDEVELKRRSIPTAFWSANRMAP